MSLTVFVNGFAIYFLSSNGILNINQLPFNAAGWILSILIALILFTSSRLIANTVLQKQSEKRVVIYGAGSAGIQLASALKVSSEMEPIAFVDEILLCIIRIWAA